VTWLGALTTTEFAWAMFAGFLLGAILGINAAAYGVALTRREIMRQIATALRPARELHRAARNSSSIPPDVTTQKEAQK
jgi:hypothetical protein